MIASICFNWVFGLWVDHARGKKELSDARDRSDGDL